MGVFDAFLSERWLTGQTINKMSNLALKLTEVSEFIPAKQLFL